MLRLVRGDALTASESRWDPHAGKVDPAVIEDADVVACLSGAPLAHWPWTERYKRTFVDSRVATTRTLSEAIAASDRKPALLSQNGIAGYGDRGDVVLTEEAANDSDTFVGGVTRVVAGGHRARRERRRPGRRDAERSRSRPARRSRQAVAPGVQGRAGRTGRQRGPVLLDHLAARLASRRDVPRDHPDRQRRLQRLGARTRRPTASSGSGSERCSTGRPSCPCRPSRSTPWLARSPPSCSTPPRVEPARLLAEGFTFDHPTLEDRLAAALVG